MSFLVYFFWSCNLGKKLKKKKKLGPKLGVLPFSQVSFISFLEIAYNDSLQNV